LESLLAIYTKGCKDKPNFGFGDLRKFTEQHGDVIGWSESNRAYILTHGVRGIEWSNYRHPLPEHVYDVYMKYWKDIIFGPC